MKTGLCGESLVDFRSWRARPFLTTRLFCSRLALLSWAGAVQSFRMKRVGIVRLVSKSRRKRALDLLYTWANTIRNNVRLRHGKLRIACAQTRAYLLTRGLLDLLHGFWYCFVPADKGFESPLQRCTSLQSPAGCGIDSRTPKSCRWLENGR